MSRRILVIGITALSIFRGLSGFAGPYSTNLTKSCISVEDAVAIALNDLITTDDGFRVENPRHIAEFDLDGISFKPVRGGPLWHWQLAFIGDSSKHLFTNEFSRVRPATKGPRQICYNRNWIQEEYVLRSNSIEQRFVIPHPLPLKDSDLIISGNVDCRGKLISTIKGWVWEVGDGVVSMGKVSVLDARGRRLIASMEVTGKMTQIIVDGRDLANAVYPVTIDPEITTVDFRISDMGPDGDIDFDAQESAVAFNSDENEYLVVWAADDNAFGVTEGEFEIFGQRIDAVTGYEIGSNDFRISDMGPDGDPNYDASAPAIIYNPDNNEYLVVWEADDNTGYLIDGEFEIFGQRLSGSTGGEIGTNDFRISDMGADGNANFDAVNPAVVHNTINDEYLVAWAGEDGSFSGEYEIYCQRLSGGDGSPVGINDFCISDMGPAGDIDFDARTPAIAYSSTENEYLVVWQGEDDTDGLVEGEFEIFGQRLDAATGAQIGVNDFRLSDMGPDGDDIYDAANPGITYSEVTNEYLIVWQADDNTDGLQPDEIEIFAQRISASTGQEVGINDFRISDMGPDGETFYDARSPSVAYDPDNNEYLVVWEGDDDQNNLVNGEEEIFGQRINASSGIEIGINDFRLSDMGSDGSTHFDATRPAVVFGTVGIGYLVTWQGDQDTLGLADDEFEIYGQRVEAGSGDEIGINDFRISDMGVDGDIDFDAGNPAVAFNSINDEYLVVWEGDDNIGTLVDGEAEIFGQRIDAATGDELGINDFRISDMGPDSDPSFDAVDPAVAFNNINNEYLVVWSGEDGPVIGEFEIYCQRLNGVTGSEVGANDFRISDMGPDGYDTYDAKAPAVIYNSQNNNYLVVWSGDDNSGTLVDGESEIFGQRLDAATGTEIGVNDFRISDMGPDGDNLFDALSPAVAYDYTNNEYVVVWEGEDNTGALVEGEFEIFGQRLDGITGSELGINDFRISDMGIEGNNIYDATDPALAYNNLDNQYLVVWEGDDDTAPLVNGEFEIFGQRLDASTGGELGANDFRISDAGPDGSTIYDAYNPSVAFNVSASEYIVVWEADDDAYNTVEGEYEIYGQLIEASTGFEIGFNDFRISSMGAESNPLFDAFDPAVAPPNSAGGYFTVWRGDDGTEALRNDEFEIYGDISLDAISCDYIPGDCNHNGTPLELADVIAMIGMYRGSVEPPYECSCPPHGDNFTPTADPNGNCVANELSDVVTEIGAYRGTVSASGCVDCPGSLRLLPGEKEKLPVIPSLKSKMKVKSRPERQ